MRLLHPSTAVCLLLCCFPAAAAAAEAAAEAAAAQTEVSQLEETGENTETEALSLPEEFEMIPYADFASSKRLRTPPVPVADENAKVESLVEAAASKPSSRPGMTRMVLGFSLLCFLLLVNYLDTTGGSDDDDDFPSLVEVAEDIVSMMENADDKISEMIGLDVEVQVLSYFMALLLFAHGADRVFTGLAKPQKMQQGGPQLPPLEGVFPAAVGLGGMATSVLLPSFLPSAGFGFPLFAFGTVMIIKSAIEMATQKRRLKAAEAEMQAPAGNTEDQQGNLN